MSMKQIEPYVRSCPLASSIPEPQPRWIYYFLYDNYYRVEKFEMLCPTACKVGIAWLQGWVWHINVKGEQNIRKMAYNGKDPYQNAITSGTWGHVYRLPKEEDEKLHAIFGVDRVRMCQCVTVKSHSQPNGIMGLPVILYYDPRNTRDGWNYHRWNSGVDEQRKWSQGLSRLHHEGAQHWYITHILEIARGIKENYATISANPQDPSIQVKPHDNTIYVNPQDLFYTPPTTTKPPTPPQLRTQGQAAIGRAEQAIARSQTAPSRQQSPSKPQSATRPQSVSKPQSAPPTQSASKPQPAPQPQSALKPQPAPPTPSVSKPQSDTRPQLATASKSTHQQSGNKTQPAKQQLTLSPTSLGLNLKVVKKRKSDSSDDRGQPMKKPMMKKPPPGPSNLRHGTPA